MVEMIFNMLHMVGFTHPVHPAMTHIPMGMVMGAFFFGLAGIILKKPDFFKSAHHCVGLGLIFILPTAFAGYLDWEHTMDGQWETLIIVKMVLAVILTLLLGVSFTLGRKEDVNNNIIFALYVLCLMCAVGLGYSGGSLQFG